jgi:hypothetical protein
MPIPSVSPTGVTAIDTTAGAVTVRAVEDETPARLAEIFAEPEANAFTSPLELIVAVVVEVELQLTRLVKSALLPSL